MTLSGYISGIIGLTKDFIRLSFGLLKRPHYVVVLIVLILGGFYFCGVSPREIPPLIQKKWQALVENRKKVFSEEMQSISDRIGDKSNPLKKLTRQPDAGQPAGTQEKNADVSVFTQPDISEQEQYLFEEKFGWQEALASFENEKPEVPEENIIRGVLSVVSANKIHISGREFSLKVKLRSGKAGDAFFQLKRRFDGLNAKCLPDPENSGFADCFVGALGISEMLIDFGYADPL